MLLAMVFLSQWMYADIVEYLKLTQQLNYLHYILPLKWFLVLGSIGLSAYLLLTMFKGEKSDEKKQKKRTKEKPKSQKDNALTQREESFLKRKIRSKADILMGR
jgi:hypothetical protein